MTPLRPELIVITLGVMPNETIEVSFNSYCGVA